MSSFKIVIPARYASSRLPGKPLRPLAGKPMIVHVCERAMETGAEQIVVAVDDPRIAAAIEHLPVTVLVTRTDHASGTERLVEVAQRMAWGDDALILNLQGDEPLMQPDLARHLAEAFSRQQDAQVATLAAPILTAEELFDPNVVKVVVDHASCALYFSRAPIPWDRERFSEEGPVLPESMSYLRHIGMYAYSAGLLRRYAAWPASWIEQAERLEQLRILWYGERIYVLAVSASPPPGVDTEADAQRVEAELLRRSGAGVGS